MAKQKQLISPTHHFIYLALPSRHGVEAGLSAGFVDQDGAERVLVESSGDSPEHILHRGVPPWDGVLFEVELEVQDLAEVEIDGGAMLSYRSERTFNPF